MAHLKKILIGALFLWITIGLTGPVWAIPNLQIYIPGATYDTLTETWVIESYDYDLLVVGANLDINDVKIAIAVPEDEIGTVTLSWGGITNPLTMTESGGMGYTEYFNAYSADGHTSANHDYLTYGFGVASTGDYPLMGDGAPLAGHGVFPTDFYEYYIGDFGADVEDVYNFNPPDGYVGDSYFIDYPGDLASLDSGRGEIKTLHVSVTGYTWADIVAYDHVEKTNGSAKYVFSPFSHDGGGGASIPEPATMLLLGTGFLGLAGIRRKKFKK